MSQPSQPLARPLGSLSLNAIMSIHYNALSQRNTLQDNEISPYFCFDPWELSDGLLTLQICGMVLYWRCRISGWSNSILCKTAHFFSLMKSTFFLRVGVPLQKFGAQLFCFVLVLRQVGQPGFELWSTCLPLPSAEIANVSQHLILARIQFLRRNVRSIIC